MEASDDLWGDVRRAKDEAISNTEAMPLPKQNTQIPKQQPNQMRYPSAVQHQPETISTTYNFNGFSKPAKYATGIKPTYDAYEPQEAAQEVAQAKLQPTLTALLVSNKPAAAETVNAAFSFDFGPPDDTL